MSVLLYSRETWAVVKQHISPLAVSQMNCLRRICGTSLRDHVPNVDILNRCNTLSVESQLQGKRLRWLGHVLRMPNDRLPKKLLVGSMGLAHPAALGLVSMMLHCVINKIVEDSLERQDLSRTNLAHHELESVLNNNTN